MSKVLEVKIMSKYGAKIMSKVWGQNNVKSMEVK